MILPKSHPPLVTVARRDKDALFAGREDIRKLRLRANIQARPVKMSATNL